MANDDFSEPPRRADSKNPIFIFGRFLCLGHLQGLGVNLGRIFGVPSIEPFLGEGGGLARGLYRPRPPQLKARPPKCRCHRRSQGSPEMHVRTAALPRCPVRPIPSCPPRAQVVECVMELGRVRKMIESAIHQQPDLSILLGKGMPVSTYGQAIAEGRGGGGGRNVLERPYAVGGGGVPPPGRPPPPLPMFGADSQDFASAPSVPRGFTLQNLRPAFGGDHRGTLGGAPPPPIPIHPCRTPLPPLPPF